MVKKYSLSFIILAFFFSLIFFFAFYNYYVGDDCMYALNWANNFSKITSLKDIFDSQITHYNMHNGRFFIHSIVQFFEGYIGGESGHLLFSIVNSIIGVIQIVLIMTLCKARISDIKILSISILLYLTYFIIPYSPAFIINYLWTNTFNLIWLLYFFKSKCNNNIFALLIMIIVSIVIGNAHEGISIGIGFASTLYMIQNRKQIKSHQIALYIGYIIGTLSVCLAPGSIGRFNHQNHFSLILFAQKIYYLLVSSKIVYLLLILIFTKLRKVSKRELYSKYSFYFNGIFILVLFNLVIQISSNRQLFGIEFLSSIIILKLLIDYHIEISKYFIIIYTTIISLLYVHFSSNLIMNRSIYQDIIKKYDNGNNGTIYVDIPNNYYLSNYNSYSWFPFTIYLKTLASNPNAKELIILPELAKDFKGKAVVAPMKFKGGYALVKSPTDTTSRFKMTTIVDFGVIQIPFKKYEMGKFKSIYKDDNINVSVMYDNWIPWPFVTIKSIEAI